MGDDREADLTPHRRDVRQLVGIQDRSHRDHDAVRDLEGRHADGALDDAATATVLALEQGATGIYNVVDDDPAPASDCPSARNVSSCGLT